MSRMKVAERRAELVAAALRVMGEHGVAAATTRAVVAEAGMSLASFHYAFTSREEMMGEAILACRDNSLATLDTFEPTATDPVGLARECLTVFVDRLLAQPGQAAAMIELTLYAVRVPALAELAQQQYTGYLDRCAATIAQLESRVGFRCGWSPEESATVLLACVRGIALQWLATRDREAVRTAIDVAATALGSTLVPHPTES